MLAVRGSRQRCFERWHLERVQRCAYGVPLLFESTLLVVLTVSMHLMQRHEPAAPIRNIDRTLLIFQSFNIFLTFRREGLGDLAPDGNISLEFSYILGGCISAVLNCTAIFIIKLTRYRGCLSGKTLSDKTLCQISLKIQEALTQIHGDVPHLRASLRRLEIDVKPNNYFVIELCKC